MDPEEKAPRPRWDENAPLARDTWWSTWGKGAAYLLLAIIGLVAALLIALLIAGVLL